MTQFGWIIIFCQVVGSQCTTITSTVNGTNMQCRAMLMMNETSRQTKAACVSPAGEVIWK